MGLLSISKLALYGMFLNYYCYYVMKGSFIPYGTILFFCIACMGVGMDAFRQRFVYIGNEVKCWLVYAVLSFLSTSLIASGTGYIGDISKYVQRLMIIMMVAYICEREKSIRFGLRLMAITTVACSISILTVVDDIQRKLSISTGANLSANDIGAIMAFGCFAILFCVGNRNKTSTLLYVLKIAGVISAISVISIAGSRKSIGAVAIMLVLLIIMCGADYGKNYNLRKIFSLMLVVIIGYWFIDTYLISYAEQTNLYTRLLGRGAEGASQSDEIRIELYRLAIQDFLEHPFMGLGFNGYARAHGNYSHSTYVEPLACSGIISFFYLYPYISILKKQIYLIRINERGSLARVKQKEIFIYLCMFLFVGVGIPYMYKDVPCILLGTFIASQANSFEELWTKGVTSKEY